MKKDIDLETLERNEGDDGVVKIYELTDIIFHLSEGPISCKLQE